MTCDAVLAETAFHLQSTVIALALVREGLVKPALEILEHLPRLRQLAERYADRKRIWRTFASSA